MKSRTRPLIALLSLMMVVTVVHLTHCPNGVTCSSGLSCVMGSENEPVCIPQICTQRKKRGRCRARKPRFYFNTHTMSCRPFTYGGCRGNSNRFYTLEECERACFPMM